MKIVVLIGSVKKTDLEGYRTMSSALAESNLNRALELIGGSIDPEIAESYPSLEARILAQAMPPPPIGIEIGTSAVTEVGACVDTPSSREPMVPALSDTTSSAISSIFTPDPSGL